MEGRTVHRRGRGGEKWVEREDEGGDWICLVHIR